MRVLAFRFAVIVFVVANALTSGCGTKTEPVSQSVQPSSPGDLPAGEEGVMDDQR